MLRYYTVVYKEGEECSEYDVDPKGALMVIGGKPDDYHWVEDILDALGLGVS